MAKSVLVKKQVKTQGSVDFKSMSFEEQQEFLTNVFIGNFKTLVGDIDLVSRTKKTSVVSVNTRISLKNANKILDILKAKGYIESYSIASMEDNTYGYTRTITQEITVKGSFDLTKLPEELVKRLNLSVNNALARLGF